MATDSGAYIIKVAIDAIGCGLFQTVLDVDLLVIVSSIESQFIHQPLDFVVCAGVTDHKTSYLTLLLLSLIN